MKIFIVAGLLLAGPTAIAQTGRDIAKDSLEMSMEREVLQRSLTQVRDSISQTLMAIEEKQTIVTPKSKRVLNRASKELSVQKNILERDLQYFLTPATPDGKTTNLISVKSNLTNVRAIYKRIRLELTSHLSTVKS